MSPPAAPARVPRQLQAGGPQPSPDAAKQQTEFQQHQIAIREQPKRELQPEQQRRQELERQRAQALEQKRRQEAQLQEEQRLKELAEKRQRELALERERQRQAEEQQVLQEKERRRRQEQLEAPEQEIDGLFDGELAQGDDEFLPVAQSPSPEPEKPQELDERDQQAIDDLFGDGPEDLQELLAADTSSSLNPEKSQELDKKAQNETEADQPPEDDLVAEYQELLAEDQPRLPKVEELLLVDNTQGPAQSKKQTGDKSPEPNVDRSLKDDLLVEYQELLVEDKPQLPEAEEPLAADTPRDFDEESIISDADDPSDDEKPPKRDPLAEYLAKLPKEALDPDSESDSDDSEEENLEQKRLIREAVQLFAVEERCRPEAPPEPDSDEDEPEPPVVKRAPTRTQTPPPQTVRQPRPVTQPPPPRVPVASNRNMQKRELDSWRSVYDLHNAGVNLNTEYSVSIGFEFDFD